MSGRRRGYDECLCRYCAPPGAVRKYVKEMTRRNNRIWDKWNIKEQYDDHLYGIDPEEGYE